MQTRKCRAVFVRVPGKTSFWEVTHPDSTVTVWSNTPHEGALHLLQKYVVPAQVA